jgi:YL1 nuclear protein/YL1 nuclear protein C-terminal domain
MTAVQERSRRSTAGKRMSALVGKAVEEDDAFWNNDTWAEGDCDEADAASFRESDEDSNARKDEFDSDFDDSESDHEMDEREAGKVEDLLLQRSERMERRQKVMDLSRQQIRKKVKGRTTGNRILGEGLNAGLVLKLPSSLNSKDVTNSERISSIPPAVPTSLIPESSRDEEKEISFSEGINKKKNSVVTLASTRSRRSTPRSIIGNDDSKTKKIENEQHQLQHNQNCSLKHQDRKNQQKIQQKPSNASKRLTNKQRFTQEDLLLEAAKVTEPENERWLLARKRLHQQEEAIRTKSLLFSSSSISQSKLIYRYISRRGCLTTIHFADMDSVPKILIKSSNTTDLPLNNHHNYQLEKSTSSNKKQHQQQVHDPSLCVITGKKARYRDPKTLAGYFDLAAFRELRRRYEAGETLSIKNNADNLDSSPSSSAISSLGDGKGVDTVLSSSFSSIQVTSKDGIEKIIEETEDIQQPKEKILMGQLSTHNATNVDMFTQKVESVSSSYGKTKIMSVPSQVDPKASVSLSPHSSIACDPPISDYTTAAISKTMRSPEAVTNSVQSQNPIQNIGIETSSTTGVIFNSECLDRQLTTTVALDDSNSKQISLSANMAQSIPALSKQLHPQPTSTFAIQSSSGMSSVSSANVGEHPSISLDSTRKRTYDESMQIKEEGEISNLALPPSSKSEEVTGASLTLSTHCTFSPSDLVHTALTAYMEQCHVRKKKQIKSTNSN